MAEDDKELFQRYVDTLFAGRVTVSRLDAVLRAEAIDLPYELLEIVELLPPGVYNRQSITDQFNSALKGHGWTGAYGTVD